MNQMTTFGGMQVLPAGAASRQELRYLLEEAKRSGRPYIEAPRTYTRGGREEDRYGRTKDLTGFYDEQGRRSYGSILGGGSYGGHGAGIKKREDRPVKLKEPIGIPSQQEQPSKETPEGYMRNRYGYLEKDYSKEGYEKDRYGYWQKKDIPKFPSK